MSDNIIPFPAADTLIEIFVGTASDPHRPDFGQEEFLVAVNESGVPFEADWDEYGGTIWWNGTSYEQARQEARELRDDFGGKIVDLTAASGRSPTL